MKEIPKTIKCEEIWDHFEYVHDALPENCIDYFEEFDGKWKVQMTTSNSYKITYFDWVTNKNILEVYPLYGHIIAGEDKRLAAICFVDMMNNKLSNRAKKKTMTKREYARFIKKMDLDFGIFKISDNGAEYLGDNEEVKSFITKANKLFALL